MLGKIGFILCIRGGSGPFIHFNVALDTLRIGIGTHLTYRFLWSWINRGVGGEELLFILELQCTKTCS